MIVVNRTNRKKYLLGHEDHLMNFTKEQIKTEKKLETRNECAIRNLPISIKIIFLQLHTGIVGTFMALKCYSRGMRQSDQSYFLGEDYLNTIPILPFWLLVTYSLNNYLHCNAEYL